MNLRHIALLFLIVIACSAWLLMEMFIHSPLVIDIQYQDATIHIETDRDKVVFPNDCYNIHWSMYAINAVYINDQGTTGNNQKTICGTSKLTVHYSDDTSRDYFIDPLILVRQIHIQFILITLILSLFFLFVSFRCFGNIKALQLDAKLFCQRIWQLIIQINRSSTIHKLFLLVVLCACILLRIYVSTHYFTIDEAASHNDYTSNLYQSISTYPDPNNHPLNSFLMFIERQLFGSYPFALRLHSILAGSLSVILTYTLGRVIYNERVGLLAAILVSFAPTLIYYSGQARGYIMQTMFILIMILLAHGLRQRWNYFSLLIFVIVSALAFFTLPTTLYAYTGISLWILLNAFYSAQPYKQWLSFIAFTYLAAILTIILYSQILMNQGLHSIIAHQYIVKLNWAEFSEKFIPYLNDIITTWTNSIPLWLTIIFGICFVVSFLIESRMKCKGAASLTIIMLASILIVLSIQRITPFIRIWTFIVPIIGLQIAVGFVWIIDQLAKKREEVSYIVFAMIFIFLGAATSLQQYKTISQSQWVAGIDYLEEHLASYDSTRLITYNPTAEIIEFYFLSRDIPLIYLNPKRETINLDHYYVVTAYGQHPDDHFMIWFQRSADAYELTLVFDSQDIRIYSLETQELR